MAGDIAMFMIRSPQTIELLATEHGVPLPAPAPSHYIHDPAVPYRPPVPLTPAQQAAADKAASEPAPEFESHGTATFDVDGDDTSKCRLTIASKDRVWTYIFNTRGALVSSAYEDDSIRKAKEAAARKWDSVNHEAPTFGQTQAISDKLVQQWDDRSSSVRSDLNQAQAGVPVDTRLPDRGSPF
jgi:hypothetical protein